MSLCIGKDKEGAMEGETTLEGIIMRETRGVEAFKGSQGSLNARVCREHRHQS